MIVTNKEFFTKSLCWQSLLFTRITPSLYLMIRLCRETEYRDACFPILTLVYADMNTSTPHYSEKKLVTF